MDYNVRTRLSFISLRLSPVRQSSALSSFSISLTCAPAHLSMNPLGTRKHLLLVPTPCTGSARPRPVPPPHRQIRRRGASRRPAPPGAPHRCPPGGLCRATPAGRRATFLPAGSYVDSAPSPLAAGRRRKIHTQNRSLEHQISGCRR